MKVKQQPVSFLTHGEQTIWATTYSHRLGEMRAIPSEVRTPEALKALLEAQTAAAALAATDAVMRLRELVKTFPPASEADTAGTVFARGVTR